MGVAVVESDSFIVVAGMDVTTSHTGCNFSVAGRNYPLSNYHHQDGVFTVTGRPVLVAEAGGTPGTNGGRSGNGGRRDGGGGGGGGGLSNGSGSGSNGGSNDAGGGCGVSGGRIDGGDGVGNSGGTSDGGAGVSGFGGMGTPPMLGGSGTKGIGGKKIPFWSHSSGWTAKSPAEKTAPLRLVAASRNPLAVAADMAASSHGAAALLLSAGRRCSFTEHDVTVASRLLDSGGRWTRNSPRWFVSACCRNTSLPLPSWHRTATGAPAKTQGEVIDDGLNKIKPT
uniref:Uncharacterized protein n=1 Tax=Leersia perrieri TaxID=77586 RepID=A0A0D9XII5_9ORYZ